MGESKGLDRGASYLLRWLDREPDERRQHGRQQGENDDPWE